MFVLKNLSTILFLGVLATALPQDPQLLGTTSSVISATNTADPAIRTATNTRPLIASSEDAFNSTNLSRSSGFVSVTNARFASGSPSPGSTFVGWSSIPNRSTTARFTSAYCSRASIYIESVLSGTTYAGCCDARSGTACATMSLAQHCVHNVQMIGNRTIRDCGASTCAHAVIHQSVEGAANGVQPTNFNDCSYYGSRGETLYRTLSATNAVTSALYAFTSSSSSSSNKSMSSYLTVIIIGGIIVGFIFYIVLIAMCICRAVRRKNTGAKGGTGVGRPRPSGRRIFRVDPPTVTVPPPYSKEAPVERAGLLRPATLDPGRGVR